MQEFNQIFYGKEVKEQPKKRQEPLGKELQPHGMALINFTLTEHLLDEKVQEAAEEAVVKTKKKIEKEMQKKTRDLKSYMDQ